MEIQTKYNIGDKVWIMRNDKPEQILISNIEVEIIGETITGTGGCCLASAILTFIT